MGGSESAPSTPRNEVTKVAVIDTKTRSINKIKAKVSNSVHNGRTFVRSRDPVNIRFPNCGVNRGNMNCYGAVFESGTRVITYHDDNTNAEYFYIWMEQSSDMEFMLSPTSNTNLFVNIDGGMINNAKLMLYRKNNRITSNMSTVEIDPNELWYTECVKENGKWKYYIRSTPDNDGKGNFYLKCNNEAEGISTTTSKQNNCNFIIIDASTDADLDMPINIHDRRQTMDKNTITIKDYGTHKFQETKEWFNLLKMNDKQFLNTSVNMSSTGSKLKFKVLRDFYNRYLLRTSDNKYVDLQNKKIVNEATQNCLFYTEQELFALPLSLRKTNDDEEMMNDVKFVKHMTLDYIGLGTEGVFQDGLSFTADAAKENQYTLSQVKFDINSIKEQHNLNYTESPAKTDKITLPTSNDKSIPPEQYFEFSFEGKTHVVFNWYKWILETVKPLENKDSYPLLAALFEFCEKGIVTGNTNKTYFDIDFVAEGASDEKRSACIGWNRYRSTQLTDEMCYLKHVLSFAIQSYITDNIGKQPSGHSLESIIKSLFIKNNLLLKHNLAGLTYFRLMEIFGVKEADIKNVIPHIDKNVSLPIWDNNLNPFTTDTNEMTDYKVIDNDISKIVSDRQNPFIFINATKDHTIAVADKNTSLNTLSESVNGLIYNNIFENETTIISKDKELDTSNSLLPYNGKIKIGKRDAGIFVKREINSSGSVKAEIKFNIKVKWIGTGGKSPRAGSKLFGKEPGGTHAEFCVPESITVDESSWNNNLPRSWIKELNNALSQNSIHIEWSSNYGGCYGAAWSTIAPREAIVVNHHQVLGKSAGDGHYCNEVFGGGWCEKHSAYNRNHAYLKINLKKMKQRLEELCKDRTATIIPNQSSMNFNTHFCKPSDFNTLRGLYHYKHYHNEEFENGWVWLWARITNWENCYGNDNSNILNQAVHDCVKEGRDGSFTVTIEDKDDTQGNMYATNYKPIKDKGINNLSEQEIYAYIDANQLCQNLPPADKYKYESFQCKLITDKTIRLFDDRFDKVIMNTLTNQSNLSKITNRFSDELRKIVDSKPIEDKLRYASLADGYVNKINLRYSIESPLYPAAAIVDYSLMKKAGVYSPDESQVAFGDQNKLVINDKDNTNLSKLFEVIASSLANNDLLVRTTTEDGKELYSAPGFIVIKLQTGCGHLLNLFNQYDPSKGFVTVTSCARTDLTHHLSNDTSSVYFVLEPILKDDPYKEDDTMTSANELHIVKTSYPIRILEKTSTQFSFIDQKFRIYYKDASTRADDNEAMTETSVTMLNKSITGIEAEALKYDYRITKRFGTQSIKVASFMTKYDGSEVIDLF